MTATIDTAEETITKEAIYDVVDLRKLFGIDPDYISTIIEPRIVANIKDKFLLTANCKQQATPNIYALAGGPCAGKNFIYNKMSSEGKVPAHAVIHDPDLVMEEIPQYQAAIKRDPVMAFKTWDLPARNIANDILLQALDLRYNIVYIRTFALKDSLDFVRLAKNRGYKVNINIIMCDLEVALERAKQIEAITKRHIPSKSLLQRHVTLANLLPEIVALADNHSIIWNN